MNKILDIKAPEGNKHIVWEHLMKSVFAFSGMFALLFFGPMFLESGGRRRSLGDGKGIAYDFLIYLISHPEIQFLICVLAVIAYNIYLVIRNTRSKYVVSLNLVDSTIEIGMTNLYYKNTITKDLPISDLSYTIESKKDSSNEKKQTLKFVDKSTGKVIGVIKPKHFIWNEQVPQVKKALAELTQLGVKKGKA